MGDEGAVVAGLQLHRRAVPGVRAELAQHPFRPFRAAVPSVSTLQRLTRTMHERWETLGPETLDSIRDAEGVPHEAVSASVSLDGVMVPLRAGEDGRAEASWREAACGTVWTHPGKVEAPYTVCIASASNLTGLVKSSVECRRTGL